MLAKRQESANRAGIDQRCLLMTACILRRDAGGTP